MSPLNSSAINSYCNSSFLTFVGSDPGIPLNEATGTQEFYGMSVPIDGYLVPTDGKGFGIELTLDDIEKWVS